VLLRLSDARKRGILVQAGLLIAAIAILDWRIDLNISFGFLYLFPILLVANVLSRWQIVALAVLCTTLSDLLDPFRFTFGVALPQDILVFTSLAGTGLFAYELTRSRRRVQEEVAARREAEQQLEFLIESSPAAILTTSTDCTVIRANSAADRLFGLNPGGLRGKNIRRYVPALARVPFTGGAHQAFRTEMQCRGERENGDIFLANVFFSTYGTASGPRLAALIVDASEDLREREEAGLEQLMSGSRILVGAVSHEVRNVCGAIAVIYENLLRRGGLNGNQDFEALGALVETLSRIASLELKQTSGEQTAEAADLAEILDDLRIVLEPYCKDSEIDLHWKIAPALPLVWADRHRLLQVLLNLAKNSERAMRNTETKTVHIDVTPGPSAVSIRFTDSGPGIDSPAKLFQPFQKGAESTGLGLYLSRALLRSFRGELRYDAAAPGCSFVIDLAIAGVPRENQDAAHTTLTAR
jgi:two-component system, LuxR family, sensor kinase FixL